MSLQRKMQSLYVINGVHGAQWTRFGEKTRVETSVGFLSDVYALNIFL